MNTARYLKMTALVGFAIVRLFATITPAVAPSRIEVPRTEHSISFWHGCAHHNEKKAPGIRGL